MELVSNYPFLNLFQVVPHLRNVCIEAAGVKVIRLLCKQGRLAGHQAATKYHVQLMTSSSKELMKVAQILSHTRLATLRVDVRLSQGEC